MKINEMKIWQKSNLFEVKMCLYVLDEALCERSEYARCSFS